MKINIRLNKNFTTQYNKLQDEFGTEIARLNGFDDDQLSHSDFIDNFIDTKVVADASIDGNSNVGKKDIVTLLNEMPKPHRMIGFAQNGLANFICTTQTPPLLNIIVLLMI